MIFSSINTVSVIVSAVAGFLFGGVWYGVLSKAWIEAAGLTEAQIKGTGGPNPAPLLLAFGANLVMGYMLSALLGAQAPYGILQGATMGVLIAAGFVLTTLVVNHTFQQARRTLTLIDGGHWLGVLAVQGAVLGWFSGG